MNFAEGGADTPLKRVRRGIGADGPLMFVGVDGGGTGTRIACSDKAGRLRTTATGPASALSLGVDEAWQVIRSLCETTFARLELPLDWGRCIVAAGMAGAHHDEWRQQFVERSPGVAMLFVESDSYMVQYGAHGGAPGVTIALGTGSVGEVLFADGRRNVVGGYGFPAGDEASGAWIGLRASRHVQFVMDGRAEPDDLARDLLFAMAVRTRDDLIRWLCAATPGRYAALAPTILAHARHPVSRAILKDAGEEIARMIAALDPAGGLPVALCGGVGRRLREYLRAPLRARVTEPRADAVQGALQIALRLAEAGR
jgi:glucosamine kinase